MATKIDRSTKQPVCLRCKETSAGRSPVTRIPIWTVVALVLIPSGLLAQELEFCGRSYAPDTKHVACSDDTAMLLPLQAFTQLESLKLRGDGFDDLRILTHLTTLKKLDLEETGVRDLSPLAGLSQLELLNLRESPVVNIRPLTGLTALTQVDLAGTRVTDIQALSGLDKLEYLFLNFTEISDVSPLVGLPEVKELDISFTKVSNIDALSHWTQLEALYQAGTTIKAEAFVPLRQSSPQLVI